MRIGKWVGCGAVVIVAAITSGAATAQAAPAKDYNIAAQSVAATMQAIARVSGENIAAPADLVSGHQAAAVKGYLRTEDALHVALAGSGLQAVRTEGGFVIRPLDDAAAPLDDPQHDIVVTGSRIRGANVASPVITLDRKAIRDAGQSTVAEAARTIPQNFGGGQNPGVGNNVPATSGVNVGGAASINLRGIGSDATLTLVNGHRLSYSASRQAIDISSIPLGAVDRIEIVPDGASALYGSDAVAGVANIILRRDFDGIETSARLGWATEGGDFEQRYGVTAGQKWQSGGFVATYEFGRTTPIVGRERSYTSATQPALTLLPLLRNHSATVSGHQDLLPGLSFELDALYNNRFSSSEYALNAAGIVTTGGAHLAFTSRSFVIAPTLRLDAGSGWQVFATGSYGQDHTRYDVISYSAGKATPTLGSCYCNNAKAAELGGDGPLFSDAAGDIKLAAGMGYRANNFIRFNGVGADTNVAHDQSSYYAYAELNVPIVGSAQNIRWIDRLTLDTAVRYERYPGVGSVATPKVGLVYAPLPDLDLKASWGKSFRSPTLYQRYQSRTLVLVGPAAFGGTGYPAGSTALLLQGGNADLRPERAASWSATIDLHPRTIAGLDLQVSYFSTRYRDRIVTPIAFLSQSLSNPIYASRVTANPSPALLAQLIASSISLTNASGAAYDPSKVAVYIDDSNVNAGRQRIRGVDAFARYRAELSTNDAITITGNLAYLESEQQLGPTLPTTQLAGIIFNPPHWRGRLTTAWTAGGFAATAAGNYIGGVDDTRKTTTFRVGSMTTFDLALRYRVSGHGSFGGLELVGSLQNLFDVKPSPIATTLLYDAPYDSTNQSPIGRFVSFSVTKKW